MPPSPARADHFFYDGYTVDPARGEVRCTYSTAGHTFTERYVFGPDGNWGDPAVEAAVRILFLLAGVSYYKTTAAPVIDLGSTPASADEKAFLTEYYLHGLGEFAHRNRIDLGDLEIVGPDADPAASLDYEPVARRPLIPFGGGMDSIVTVSSLGADGPDAALCIVHPPGDRFAAIEDAAAVTGLPIVRIAREIDPAVRRSSELGFLNGHVPVTAVITAAALVAAVLDRRDAVVLSNEWSASVPTLVRDGRPVNHQWSKGAEFELGFALMVASTLGTRLSVFSYLRCRSELWVAHEFASLTDFHGVFRSCNRSFHQDPAKRLARWCGTCDKCCFIDLILSPFMRAGELNAVFGGHEPLENPHLEARFSTMLGLAPEAKPFECVGDVNECRAALLIAAERHDRQGTPLLRSLRGAVRAVAGRERDSLTVGELLAPLGPHNVPDRYAPPDLLVRAH
jgi:UDP-N-acetyl-alpha-D-muramoyl-L-alanyl-L-glutamate epimerase